MKPPKGVAILFFVYVGVVVGFESLIGYFQPKDAGTIVIATHDDSGNAKQRVVARLESDGKLYVAANHWPRRWYNEVLSIRKVDVTWDGTTRRTSRCPLPVRSSIV